MLMHKFCESKTSQKCSTLHEKPHIYKCDLRCISYLKCFPYIIFKTHLYLFQICNCIIIFALGTLRRYLPKYSPKLAVCVPQWHFFWLCWVLLHPYSSLLDPEDPYCCSVNGKCTPDSDMET